MALIVKDVNGTELLNLSVSESVMIDMAGPSTMSVGHHDQPEPGRQYFTVQGYTTVTITVPTS